MFANPIVQSKTISLPQTHTAGVQGSGNTRYVSRSVIVIHKRDLVSMPAIPKRLISNAQSHQDISWRKAMEEVIRDRSEAWEKLASL